MSSDSEVTPTTMPHVVLISFPAQGHINPLLNLAKLLHSRHFHITFVVTEFTYRRLLLHSRDPKSVTDLPNFHFRTIPDGLPPSDDVNKTQDIPSLCESTRKSCLVPFAELVKEVDESDGSPRVCCIISDGAMSFTVFAGEELNIPVVMFMTHSACGFLGYLSFQELVNRGYIPLKADSYLTNGYLDTPIDFIQGLNNVRLRDIPSFIRTTKPDDLMLNIMMKRKQEILRAQGIIFNTFEDLDQDTISSIRCKNPDVYAIGPLSPISRQISSPIASNLWKEDTHCLDWLDKRDKGSVVYVNFGSITTVSEEQLQEFAWGLASSKQPFLWVIRPDLVNGSNAKLSDDFVKEIEGRGVLAQWCNQEAVLEHEAVGGFLTHCGWNSTIESIYEGVPMICWPFFAEQHTNCRYACTEWGIGMEIDNDVKREEVEGLIRELMGGEKGKEMRRRALQWKEKARRAIGTSGYSNVQLNRLVEDLLHMKKRL